MDDWQRDVYNGIKKENEDSGAIGGRAELVSFISRSSGRGKMRPRPKEVELVRVGSYALPVVRGEIRQSKTNSSALHPDELAEEILGRGSSASELLEALRVRQNRR